MQVNKHIKLSELVIIVTFVVMVVSTLTQVICRYLLQFSLPWVDELARYCLVWMVFVGMVLTLVRGQHVTVDLMLDRYSIRFRPFALTIIDLATSGLFLVLLYGGVLLMQLTAGQTTSGLGIPKYMVYAALPIGALLMLIELGQRIYRRHRASQPK
jgi:TRAP-type C4-dicarboxylate transport system permease small subunit